MTNFRGIRVVLCAVLFVLSSGCRARRSENAEYPLGLDIRVLEAAGVDAEASAIVEGIYSTTSSPEGKSELFRYLSPEFSRYQALVARDWRLDGLTIKRVVFADDSFFYCLYESTQRIDDGRFNSNGVLLFSKNGGHWELLNFPFSGSNLPEFASVSGAKIRL